MQHFPGTLFDFQEDQDPLSLKWTEDWITRK